VGILGSAAVLLSACNTVHGTTQQTTASYSVEAAQPGQPSRRGNAALRFEVRDGDCWSNSSWNDCTSDRARSELSMNSYKFRPGEDFWAAYSIYIPTDLPDLGPVQLNLAAIKNEAPVMNVGGSGVQVGIKSANKNGGSGAFIMYNVHDGNYQLQLFKLQEMYGELHPTNRTWVLKPIKAMRGHWTDVMVHVDMTNPDDLQLSAWVDGRQVIAAEHLHMGMVAPNYYQKIGVYEIGVDEYRASKHAPVPTVVVYYDEVRVGHTRDAVDIRTNPKL